MASIDDGIVMSKKIKIVPMEKHSDSFINIAPASDFIPEWYRKSSNKIEGESNILDSELAVTNTSVTTSTYKKCTPFYDALTAGYMVFLTADLEVSRKPDGLPYLMWRTDRLIITEHTLQQWKGLPCPEGYSSYVYKWHNQFAIKTPKNYSMLFLNPSNRFDLPFQTINGIVDTDSYDLQIHFPFFIKNNFKGVITKGTPIAQIIPIQRESWKREIEKYDDNKKHVALENFRSTIKRSYKNNYWQRKEYK